MNAGRLLGIHGTGPGGALASPAPGVAASAAFIEAGRRMAARDAQVHDTAREPERASDMAPQQA